jgi:hypothetical protein
MNDTYSKIMLTIIAVALSINAFMNLNIVNPAHAAGGVQKIAICNDMGTQCAKIYSYGGLAVKN